MPHVQITMLEGRSEEQKRRVAEGVTRLLVEEAGARSEAVLSNPGEWGPSSATLRIASAPWRLLQSVRNSTQAPDGILPWSPSHVLM